MIHPARSYAVKRLSPYLLILFLLFGWSASARPDEVRRELSPGVTLVQETWTSTAGPTVANVLRVDLKRPGVHVQTAIAREVILTDEPAKGREALGALASRHHALAAINGDFFPFTGDPLGI